MMKRYPDDKELHRVTMREITKKSRDNARTPMQWDSTANAGFSPSGVTPWQRVNESYPIINAAAQVDDPASVFSYYKNLLAIRKKHADLLVYGKYELVDDGSEDVFAYFRSYENERVLVATNWREQEQKFVLPEGVKLKSGGRLVGNYDQVKEVADGATDIQLRPFEAFVWFVEQK